MNPDFVIEVHRRNTWERNSWRTVLQKYMKKCHLNSKALQRADAMIENPAMQKLDSGKSLFKKSSLCFVGFLTK